MLKGCFITVVALLLSTCLFGQLTPEDLVKKDWPNTYGTFGKELRSKPLNFIFVLDISDKKFGNEIKDVVNNFLKPVKDGDNFNVILLGSTDKTVNLTECARVSNAKKNDISSEINKTVFGTIGSDGVKMTGLVLDALSCSGASSATPIVFIFSDFVHYDNGWSVPGVRYWNPLVSRYETTKKNIEKPYVYCIELPNVDRKAQYLNNLKQIFKDLSTVTCSSASLLEDKFNDIRAKITKKLLHDFVIEKSKSQNLNISLENNDGQVVLKGFNALVYHKLVLDNESNVEVSQILNSDLLYSFFPPTETEIEVSGTLVAEKYKNEIPELTDVELKNQKISLMIADSLIPWWLTDIIVIFLLFSIFRFIWTIIPPARLRGSMDFYTQGKSTIVIDCFGNNKKISNNEVSLLKNDFSLEIRATKKFLKGKCLIIYPLNGDLLLDSRKVKKTAPRGKKTIASTRSKWTVDGINITMPNVK